MTAVFYTVKKRNVSIRYDESTSGSCFLMTILVRMCYITEYKVTHSPEFLMKRAWHFIQEQLLFTQNQAMRMYFTSHVVLVPAIIAWPNSDLMSLETFHKFLIQILPGKQGIELFDKALRICDNEMTNIFETHKVYSCSKIIRGRWFPELW